MYGLAYRGNGAWKMLIEYDTIQSNRLVTASSSETLTTSMCKETVVLVTMKLFASAIKMQVSACLGTSSNPLPQIYTHIAIIRYTDSKDDHHQEMIVSSTSFLLYIL